MLKYLLLLVALVWLFYSPAVRRMRANLQRDHKPPAQPPQPPRVEAMVRCAHCGLHLPASDAVNDSQGLAYCSPAHMQAGPKRA